MLCCTLSTTLLLAATCSLMTAVLSTKRAITCGSDGNVQRLSCDEGVISVYTALYGRANAVACSGGIPPAQLANTHCSQAGTVDVVKKRCDGKEECELNINVFYTSDPCFGTYKYLNTTYTCLPANQGQVISVNGANYGRSDHTTCIYQRPLNQVQNISCSSPTPQVAASCNGKNGCTLAANNAVFGDPCVGTYKYLELAYTCYYPGNSLLP
ncbi:L-rhamnose-binding lectin SML-like isoform X2 [Perca flavescens]|uniref:L-rhamnose-binding lectin SML-like isoform X2 n=1 Tax=Perca flavescens TaxID=8167 RepID=UPI00106DDDA3|nr:L-rhamnose-binding lectin SML-like isoform X2 [Perca flavescens]